MEYVCIVTARHWLLTLLALDLLFIVVSLARPSVSALASPMFALTEDGGYSEFYQYAKWAGIAALMFVAAHPRHGRGFAVWGLFALFLLADDALQIHERVGDWVNVWQTFTPPFNLRREDVGELASSLVAGLGFLALLVRAYRVANEHFRLATHDFAVLVGMLAIVGVGIDMAHVALDPGPTWNTALTVLEDGGEMIVASVMCWYAGVVMRVGAVTSLTRPAQLTRLRPALKDVLGRAA